MQQRRAHLGLLLLGGTVVTSEVLALGASKSDKRLLGTWRSDKERTTSRWKYKPGADPEKRAAFEDIFGKLVVRFTATRAYSEYDGEKKWERYSVLASDSKSVVIAQQHAGSLLLQQMFFEEEWFYVVSGYNLEFFRRVEA